MPVQQANQFKSIDPLCASTDANESHENLRISYRYRTDINDTGQVKAAVKFRFWNLSKGSLLFAVEKICTKFRYSFTDETQCFI